MFWKRKTFSLVFVILVMWAKTLEGVAQNGKRFAYQKKNFQEFNSVT